MIKLPTKSSAAAGQIPAAVFFILENQAVAAPGRLPAVLDRCTF